MGHNVVSVRAGRRPLHADGDELVIDERPQGEFSRQLFLGDNLDSPKLSANVDRGVLTITVLVAESSKPRGSRSITKGLQECVREFRKLDEELDVAPMLAQVIASPPLHQTISADGRDRLLGIAGGLSVAPARAFPLVAPPVKNPRTAEREQVFALFDLLR